MSGKLLPCPFCGGHVDRATRKPAGMDVDFVINCQKCYLKFSPFCATEEDCERLWNLRPVLAQEAGPLVERQEPDAYMVRYRHVLTEASKAADGKDHFSQWGKWEPASIEYAEAVTHPGRNNPVCYEMKPLYASPPAPVAASDPCEWSDSQILDFLGVALRNVDLSGEVKLIEIRQGFEYVRQNACLDKVKELNQ